MKIDAKLQSIHYDYAQKSTIIQFSSFGNITSNLEEYLGLQVNLELKKEGKRSNTANSYLWVLLGELQEKLMIPKIEIYREYIRTCGVYAVCPIPDNEVDQFVESWEHNGTGWLCEKMPSKIKDYTNIFAYYGTSVYTTKQMAILLDQVVQDCIEQGIPTKPKEEINSLLKEWENGSRL